MLNVSPELPWGVAGWVAKAGARLLGGGPRIGKTLYERQEGLPEHVLQIARRAQVRLRAVLAAREPKQPGDLGRDCRLTIDRDKHNGKPRASGPHV